ncbi:hypothetical protein [Patulibacter defluvii]|uniref:hypothetical protein n=1 Tax=Patulibacter defluvii TaxID=3095358 RepID=UPI002A763814|nr:hypothetical protein [Patulibacter sp. DM4]
MGLGVDSISRAELADSIERARSDALRRAVGADAGGRIGRAAAFALGGFVVALGLAEGDLLLAVVGAAAIAATVAMVASIAALERQPGPGARIGDRPIAVLSRHRPGWRAATVTAPELLVVGVLATHVVLEDRAGALHLVRRSGPLARLRRALRLGRPPEAAALGAGGSVGSGVLPGRLPELVDPLGEHGR